MKTTITVLEEVLKEYAHRKKMFTFRLKKEGVNIMVPKLKVCTFTNGKSLILKCVVEEELKPSKYEYKVLIFNGEEVNKMMNLNEIQKLLA